MFIRHQRSQNSPLTTQNSLAKFCLFPDRALPVHINPPVTFQYSPISPILNETPGFLTEWVKMYNDTYFYFVFGWFGMYVFSL